MPRSAWTCQWRARSSAAVARSSSYAPVRHAASTAHFSSRAPPIRGNPRFAVVVMAVLLGALSSRHGMAGRAVGFRSGWGWRRGRAARWRGSGGERTPARDDDR